MSLGIINSRKRLIKSFFCEIILFLFFIWIGLNNFNEDLFSILYIITWIILSYIIGRYHDFKKINKISIVNNIIKTFLVCLFIINIFLFIEVAKYQNLNNIFQSKELIIFNFKFGIISSILNLIFNYSFNKNKKNKKWLILDENNLLKYIRKDSIENNQFLIKNFNIITDIKQVNKEKINRFKGLIIQNNKKLKIDEEQYIITLKRMDIPVMNNFEWCEKYLQRIPPKIIEEEINGGKFIYPRFNIFEYRIKKIFEFCISLILIFLCLPIFILAAVFIYFEDKGSIFYSQIRSGIYGKKIKIYKLRTMRINAEEDGVQWSSIDDKRVTKIGNFLRRTRIDEIPQLISVLTGEMSLIGPRPERPEIDSELIKEIPGYESRYNILPGISGWAQVNYPYGSSIKDSYNKLSYDLYYLRNFSTFLDITILFKTIRVVLKNKNAYPNID